MKGRLVACHVAVQWTFSLSDWISEKGPLCSVYKHQLGIKTVAQAILRTNSVIRDCSVMPCILGEFQALSPFESHSNG